MKVLIVDDSVVFRMAIKQALGEVEGVQIVDALSNGQLAVDFLKKGHHVDLITLDMEMPVLDGMATIKEIREFNKKVPIIVFSSLTTKGAEKTIDALSHGANDFVTKEESGGAASIEKSLEMIRHSLLPKIEVFKARKAPLPSFESVEESSTKKVVPPKGEELITMARKPNLIVMASSTGGPDALSKVFRKLDKHSSNVPILLVQHMPPVFTEKLAEMLTNISPGYTVKEGKPGDRLEPGVCYLAPGDYHMVLNPDMTIGLNQNDKVCFVRPAANVLFESVAKNFSKQIASIVLTGMGDDGAEGVKKLSELGSYNFYQDELSCTVFGMPAAVKRTGLAKELTLESVPDIINSINARV